MKKQIILVVGVLLFSTMSIYGQKKIPLGDIAKVLLEMEVFLENKKFKTDVVEQVKSISASTITDGEYHQLKSQYQQLRSIYNDEYLAVIKNDIKEVGILKGMTKNPNRYSEKYAGRYEKVVNHYNENFMPVLLSMHDDELMGDFPQIFGIAVAVFEKIVAFVSKHREGKQDKVGNALGTLNEVLFSKLELPSWVELNIQEPANDTIPSIDVESEPDDDFIEISEIPNSPTNETLEGTISFKLWDDGDLFPMEYEKVGTKNTESFEYEEPMGDQVVGKPGNAASQSTGRTIQLRTKESYGNGTFYKIAIEGSGWVYVFAINSDNRMYGFYPYIGYTYQIKENQISPVYGDQTIGTPTTTSVGSITIPERDFIQITDSKNSEAPESETLVILVSKKELDIADVMEQMEEMSEDMPPHERISKILGTGVAKADSVDVDTEHDTILYTLASNEYDIIPLTFSIMRH